MSLTLGPLFAKPLHPSDWDRPPGNTDYRVTGHFLDIDRINGGPHNAVDAGNFGDDDPLLAPATCRARGLWHWDGALGVEFDLGGSWFIECWHLSKTLPVSKPAAGQTSRGAWTDVTRGDQVGRTGATGRVTGAHTHIALLHNGKPVDPEPYLFGQAIDGADNDLAAFNDVDPGDTHYDSIAWAALRGIALPLPGGGFYADSPVTRGQLMTFLRRYDASRGGR